MPAPQGRVHSLRTIHLTVHGEKAPEPRNRDAVVAAKEKSSRLKADNAEAPSAGKSQSK